MKTFQVEIKRTSYITYIVDAESREEAEQKAWVEVEHDRVDINDAAWEVESIEEWQSESEGE